MAFMSTSSNTWEKGTPQDEQPLLAEQRTVLMLTPQIRKGFWEPRHSAGLCSEVRVRLRDIAVLVPDHCNKDIISVK